MFPPLYDGFWWVWGGKKRGKSGPGRSPGGGGVRRKKEAKRRGEGKRGRDDIDNDKGSSLDRSWGDARARRVE